MSTTGRRHRRRQTKTGPRVDAGFELIPSGRPLEGIRAPCARSPSRPPAFSQARAPVMTAQSACGIPHPASRWLYCTDTPIGSWLNAAYPAHCLLVSASIAAPDAPAGARATGDVAEGIPNYVHQLIAQLGRHSSTGGATPDVYELSARRCSPQMIRGTCATIVTASSGATARTRRSRKPCSMRSLGRRIPRAGGHRGASRPRPRRPSTRSACAMSSRRSSTTTASSPTATTQGRPGAPACAGCGYERARDLSARQLIPSSRGFGASRGGADGIDEPK